MRQIATFFTILLLQGSLVVASGAATNVAYTKQWVRNVPAHIVTVNLNSPNVRISPAIARHGVGTSEGFGSMLSRLQPTAAITGTYFCVESLEPIGDIVIDGDLVHFGPVGTGVCFTDDNQVAFKPTQYGRSTDWTGYASVLCTGPRLVKNGVAAVYPKGEGFRDPAVYRKAQRSALGVTKNNKLLMVVVDRPIYLSHMANVMKDLGAVDAVCLDGGSSTALYHDGRVFSHPGRRLTNLLVVYESPTMFSRIKGQLAPSPIVASKSGRS